MIIILSGDSTGTDPVWHLPGWLRPKSNKPYKYHHKDVNLYAMPCKLYTIGHILKLVNGRSMQYEIMTTHPLYLLKTFLFPYRGRSYCTCVQKSLKTDPLLHIRDRS